MYRKTKKLFAVALVVSMLLTMTVLSTVASAATSLKGTDRYQTALEVVKAGWTTSENAVIARGDDLADALAAAPLAYAKGKAPILLTETSALPTGVMEELTALGVKNVYIVGGTGAVSADVEAALAAKFTVKRLFGADRCATSVAIAKEAFPTAPAKAVLVNGFATADALSISSIAAYNGMPIVLADSADVVPAVVTEYLAGKTVYAVGGPGVLSDAVVGSAIRLSGDNRYGTNVAVLNTFALDYSKVFVAVGEDANNVDALGGAALAALGNNPMVLVDGSLTPDITALLTSKVSGSTVVYTLGGVVPASVATLIEAIINSVELKVVSVTAVNSRELVVDFSRDLDQFTALDEDYYEFKVNNAASAIDQANFSLALDADDASKVKVALDASVALENGDVVTAKVKKSVADESLKPMKADYITVLPVFSDTTAPSIVKVATSGNDVVVTFDDYLDTLTDATNVVKFNGNRILAAGYTLSGKTLTLTGVNNPSLAAGNYVVTVSSAEDLSGNVAGFLTKTLTVTNDFTVPAFSSIKGKSTYVFTVQFNKSLAGAPTVTAKKNGYSVNVTNVAVDSTDSTKYNVTVADNGTVTVYNSGENSSVLEVSVTNIKDTKNTIGSPVTTSVTLSKDTSAPTVIAGNTAISVNNINIQFNEAIAIVDADSIIVTDKDGIRLTGITATVEDDARYGNDTVLRLALTSLANGTYTISIPSGAVADASPNANDVAAVALTLTKTATSASDITPSVSTANNVITIEYGTEMTDSARTAANYKLDGASLPSGSILYFSGTKNTVVIELPAASIAKSEDYVLTISDAVLTAGGAKVLAAERNQTVALVDNVKPVLVSAKKLTATTVELTFNEDMDTVPASPDVTWNNDFVVKVNGVKINVTGVANDSDEATKLVLTVDAYNMDQTMTVVVGGTGITLNAADVEGNVIAANSTAITATK